MNLNLEWDSSAESGEYTSDNTMLGSIDEYCQTIKNLLRDKITTVQKVQSAMDQKARNKTPFNERQLEGFNEFTGIYAKEGGLLKEALVRIKHTQQTLHTQNTEPLWLSLLRLQKYQRNAIYSLRRIIASGEQLLELLYYNGIK